jgi:predicted nucleotidyltransferase
MDISLPEDFIEFLKLLNSKGVEYLLIGGFAVNYYGHHRATADMDVWIAMSPENAAKVVEALRDFGFNVPGLVPEVFTKENQIIRMGVPPLRIELLTTISGVTFAECYPHRRQIILDGVSVSLIGLDQLKKNKAASGRLKDLDDLQHLSTKP